MTIIEIMSTIVGNPANDMEATALYFTSCLIAALFFFFALYLFKLIGSSMKNF